MAGSCGLRGRKLLFVLVFCLSPIHSLNYDENPPLIERQCGDLKYVNVDFGGESEYKLKSLNCGDEVQLGKVKVKEAPSVTFKDAVSITF